MNSRRTVILVVAVVVGALATVGLLNYVKSAESTADEEAAPVQMWVVRQPIPKGTPIQVVIDAQMIGIEETAAKYRPSTAVIDPGAELAGLVAVNDIEVNVPIVAGYFVSPEVINTGITDRLEERGLVTVTFDVDQARSAAYLIEPGDFVNVMIERDWETPFFEETPPIDLTAAATAELAAALVAQNLSRPILTDLYPVDSRYVYQKAEVLAIGESLVPDIGQTEAETQAQAAQAVASRSLVTLAVPPEAVQVILNVGRENLYLSLVPADYEPRPLPPLDPTTQVLPGEQEGFLTPYDGYEGVENPADRLAFSDGEDRIGVTPGSGSSETSNETTDSGSVADSSSRSDSTRGGADPTATEDDSEDPETDPGTEPETVPDAEGL